MGGKPSEEAWNRGIAALLAFKAREGHCHVPRWHIERGYRLGQWVAVQRYSKGILSTKRKAQLEKIGFSWSQRDQWWEEGFAALKAFKSREGHCYVRADHIEGDVHLGNWVTMQRRRRKKMDRSRRQRLEKVGFAWRATRRRAVRLKLAALQSRNKLRRRYHLVEPSRVLP